jgi:hypothetical protein
MRPNSFLPVFLLAASFAAAQQPSTYPDAPPPPPPNFQQQLSTLADQPATHSGFVFDRNMLGMAEGVLEANGMDAQHAAAALHSIAVDNYRYERNAFYTPEVMGALIDSYHHAGWKHLVDANQTPASSAQPSRSITDLWLHFSGADIDGLTVLTRAPRMMNVVQVSCDLRPLDLMHLGGHFGIPKVDPNAVMVPAPR